jgi:predicted GNAT family acetyltransferase
MTAPIPSFGPDTIRYQRDLAGVDWEAMKATLLADEFDNGRSVEQLQRSFEASAQTVIAYHGTRIVGTARALSDGICNAYIVDVWTLSAFRRQGIASTMLRLLMAALPGQHVALFTEGADDFYAALGMHKRGTTYEAVIGRWLDNSSDSDPVGILQQ